MSMRGTVVALEGVLTSLSGWKHDGPLDALSSTRVSLRWSLAGSAGTHGFQQCIGERRSAGRSYTDNKDRIVATTQTSHLGLKTIYAKVSKDKVGTLASIVSWSVLTSVVPVVVGLIAIS